MRLQEEFVSVPGRSARSSGAPAELKELERDTAKLASVKPPFPRV